MKPNTINITLLSIALLWGMEGRVFAQTASTTSMNMTAPAAKSTILLFNTNADISTYALPESPIEWGMDVAWNSRSNVNRGTNYIGKDVLYVGRVSFQPSDLVDANGELSTAQKRTLQSRLDNIMISGVRNIVLNCDHEVLMNKDNYPNCDQNYKNYNGKPEEWYRVIKASVKYCRSQGFNVVTVSPFNEPDYTAWKEGTKTQFQEIARLITEDPELAGIRVSAGNTLNCDQALSWYNAVKPYVTEGNTHQLAGSFDNYVKFWQTVRANGHHATADELHNTMEAFVGIHYGLQTGIWWGYDGAARGEFCKASYYGKEIGYAESRSTWTAGAVYKRQNGRIDAFVGGSERQANTNTFGIVSVDRPVYFDGVGPMHAFEQKLPGGTGYQQGQTNAERMVQVQYGEDVPVEALVAGQEYVIVNRNSNMGIGYYNGATGNDIQICQNTYTGTNSSKHMRWIYEPVKANSGGDFSYFVLRSARDNSQVIDGLNWNENEGGTFIGYAGGLGANEQWFTEYAGDGFYYIRSRHSGLYLEVLGSKTTKNVKLQQANFTGAANQQWRFQPTNSALEVKAPAVPVGIEAVQQTASVKLSWTANAETDFAGYQVVRGTVDGENVQWDVIGRMIETPEFIDNLCVPGHKYIYKVRAIDRSRNISEASETLEVDYQPESGLVAWYKFDNDATDQSCNHIDAAMAGVTYNATLLKEGEASANLGGSAYMLLPPSVGCLPQMTIGAWVYVSNITSSWTRVFDFGNGENQYMFLSPNSGSEMRFVMKNMGDEQILKATKPTAGWHHLMVTLSDSEVALYNDGVVVAQTSDITLRPSDLNTVLNYVGRSQFASDPYLKGYVDDLRIYNYALSADEVASVVAGEEPETAISSLSSEPVATEIYNLNGVRLNEQTNGLNIIVRRNAAGQTQSVKRLVK